MNILYLSDIHFGRELVARGNFDNRNKIQEQLINVIANLPKGMQPNYIVVTGDIAWTGSEEEYEMAYEWFSRLLDTIGLNGERITFCVGNHDVNRKIAIQIPISFFKKDGELDLTKIDEFYKYEKINPFSVQIQAYNDFCHRLGVIPYQYYVDIDGPETDKFNFSKQWYSYTVGSKDIIYGNEKYRIVAFNTAMLSGYEELPDDENFLGLPQIEEMILQKIIGKETNFYKIAMFHHSERFLNTNEMNSYSDRPATLHKLLENVDLALCGHTETGEMPVIRKQENGGIILNGGATYYSDDHPNSFSILRIEPENALLERCTFIYSKGQWCPQKKVEEINWKEQLDKIKLFGQNLRDEPWKFTMFAEESKKEIVLNHMEFGLYIDEKEIHYHYTNKKDVTRLLDCWGDEKGVHYSIAPGRERSISAMIEYGGISYFINNLLKCGKKKVEYELTDPNGKKVAKGVMPKITYTEDEYKRYNLLVRLRKLEEKFHVCFSVPNVISIQEQCAISMLENLLEDGGGLFSYETQNKFIYFSEKKQDFEYVYEKMSKKEGKIICIGYKVPLVCDLFGTRIKLGNCRIIVTNLIPCSLDEIKKQADTFILGDRRRLTMKFVNNQQNIVILREGSENNSLVVKKLLEQIRKKAISFEVEPQALTFGINIFKPDEKIVKKKRIELNNTLTQMIEKSEKV